VTSGLCGATQKGLGSGQPHTSMAEDSPVEEEVHLASRLQSADGALGG
jgi:hypothetical protein